jgi:hypothetical protein
MCKSTYEFTKEILCYNSKIQSDHWCFGKAAALQTIISFQVVKIWHKKLTSSLML